MNITVKVDDEQLQGFLDRIIERIGHPEPALTEMGEIVKSSVMKNFQAGGRPESWPVSRRVKTFGGQTLRDAGRLMNSISGQVSDRMVIVGTSVEYAGMMQFGATKGQFGKQEVIVRGHRRMVKGKGINVRQHTRKQSMPWGTIPARPFLMVQDEDWEEIKAALADYLIHL